MLGRSVTLQEEVWVWKYLNGILNVHGYLWKLPQPKAVKKWHQHSFIWQV